MKFFKNLDKFVAPSVAFFSLLIYMITLSPTVNFWDSGEFIVCADTLQINHPPGNPTYLLLARIFAMLAFDSAHTALMVNLFSAFAAAFAVFFSCKTIFWLSNSILSNYRLNGVSLSQKEKNLISHFASGTGAMALAFSASFWAVATEAEVYSLSAMFTAMMVWIMIKYIQADESYKNRWLVLLGLIVGLSTGVHLLGILVIPALVFIFYFNRYRFSYKGFFITLLFSVLITAFLQIFISGFPIVASWFEWLFVNTIGAPYNSGLLFFIFLVIVLFILGIYFSGIKGKKILNIILTTLAVFISGYSIFAFVIIRSAANPPIDQSNPETVYNFISYLNREQYGDRPLLKGQQFSSPVNMVNPYEEGYAIYDTVDGQYKVISHKPVANYEKGSLRVMPRMWSDQPSHVLAYQEWTNASKNSIPSASQNFSFMFRYQFSHMYFRYFMWNFAGRQNDIQSHGGPFAGNWQSGIAPIDNLRLSNQEDAPSWINYNDSKAYYYFLPLILGIIGIIFQFKSDKKNLFVISLIFIYTGVAIAFYLNQTPYQARERDYAFLGSFYAFSMWIGLGTTGMFLFLRKYIKKKFLIYGTGILCIAAVPAQFISKNYASHDNSDNDFAYHFAANMLNSCDQNAILFVSGDNETFPLWYLQECENIRTDVRVVNLSYLNSDWYIDQIQRASYGNEGVQLSVSKDSYITGQCEIIPVINNTAAFYDHIYKYNHDTILKDFLAIHSKFCNLLKSSGYASRNKTEFESFEEYFKNIRPFGSNKDFLNYCSLVVNLEDAAVCQTYGISVADAESLRKDLRNFLANQKLYTTDLGICVDFMFSQDTASRVKGKIYDYPVNYCPSSQFVLTVDKAEVMKSFSKIGLREDIVVDMLTWSLDSTRKTLNKSDLMVLEIIRNNNWERPLYFSSVMNSENYLGLDRYLYLEGLAFRLIPVETEVSANDPVNINSATMYENFITKFTWGNLCYTDENVRNILTLLRTHYSKLARGLFLAGANKQSEQVINHCIKLIPNELVPFEYSSVGLVHGYYRIGKLKEAGLLSLVIADNSADEIKFYNGFSPNMINSLTPYKIRAQKTIEELMFLAQQYKNQQFAEELNKIYNNVVIKK